MGCCKSLRFFSFGSLSLLHFFGAWEMVKEKVNKVNLMLNKIINHAIRHSEFISESLKQGIFLFRNLDLFIFLLLSDTKEEKRNQKEENIAFLLSFNSKINIWKPPVRTPKKANSSYTCSHFKLHVGRSSTNVGFSSCKIFFENFYVAHQSQALSLIASSLCSGFASLLWCLFLNFSFFL